MAKYKGIEYKEMTVNGKTYSAHVVDAFAKLHAPTTGATITEDQVHFVDLFQDGGTKTDIVRVTDDFGITSYFQLQKVGSIIEVHYFNTLYLTTIFVVDET